MEVTRLKELMLEQIALQTDAAIPKYFADNALLSYESNEKEPVLETRSLMAYQAAIQTMEKFISHILMMDMAANDLRYAEAVLYLPDGDLNLSVGVQSSNMGSYLKENRQELVRTKIGIFDEFTWDMICSINAESNPVKIFYRHLSDNLHFIMVKLGLYSVDLSKTAISRELLEKYHIQESVEIHCMINLLDGVASLFDDNDIYRM